MKISIIGGGRWARTIALVLCSLDRSHRVVMHTKHDAPGVAAWIEGLGLSGKLHTATVLPDFGSKQDQPEAVIVANRAGDHFAAALPALRAGIPALVEKPMALPRNKILILTETARANGTLLAGSNVFLFSRYFDAFAELIATLGCLHRLSFTWADGLSDIRRGEAKTYDAGVALYDDVLPHIVPMLGSLQFDDLSLEEITIQRGGAELTIEARSDGRSARLDLARDGSGRQRLIEIETSGGTATLDFSAEPGFISAPGFSRSGDPLWDTAPRPLATMLAAFLAAVGGQPLNVRLSPAHAMAAGSLADAVRERYVAHQIQWLERRLGEPLDAPLRYALRELSNGGNAPAETTGSTWSAIDSAWRLKTLLTKSRLLSDAGYIP